MSTFQLKCPQCGIDLEADENDIGAKASCAECDHHFILTKSLQTDISETLVYPDLFEDIKIGQLALEGMKLVFLNKRLSPSIWESFQEPQKSKELFGIKWPLLIKKETGTFEVPRFNGYVRHWRKPISVSGVDYFLCSQWFEYHRQRLIAWLKSQGVSYDELRHELGGSLKMALIAKNNNAEDTRKKKVHAEQHKPIEDSPDPVTFSLTDIPGDLTHTKPHKVSYLGTDYELSSWKDLLREICIRLDRKYHRRLWDLRGKSFADFTKRICLRSSKHNLLSPLKIADDLWIESNFDAKTIVKLATELLRVCEIDLASIKVFYNTPLQKKVSKQSEIVEPQDISFSKKLDCSTLTMGVTITVKLQDAFLHHLTASLPCGSSMPVSICVEGTEYRASIVNVGFSDVVRNQVIQILWSNESPMAEMFRMRFPGMYHPLAEEHNNRDGSDDVIIVACGDKKDSFTVSFLQSSELGNLIDGKKIEKKINERDLTSWISALLSEFPTGFIFNSASVKLLECTVGKTCSSVVLAELKQLMFKRSDGVLLLSSMIVKYEKIDLIAERISQIFSQYGCFSLSILYDEFESGLENLPNPDSDFRLFLIKFVMPKIEGSCEIFGKLQKQICIPGSCDEKEILFDLTERIRGVLRDQGDAMLSEDICSEFPYLNSSAIDMLLQDYVSDAVAVYADDMKYWKLFEFFCLPDNFSEMLTTTIKQMERQNIAPSIQSLETEMERFYSEGFRDSYALNDDDVFRQIVAIAFRENGYEWKNKVFIQNVKKRESNVADEFLQTQTGIFHEFEFFEYAETHRGLTNTGMLILTFLRFKCIRIDQYHWISLADFERQSNFSEDMAETICQKLTNRLANHFFLPIGTLPDAFMAELPIIEINRQKYYWNEYLLASISIQKIAEIRIINDEPSPYTVTAMVIPTQAQFTGDVIEYIFKNLRVTGCQFSSANMVFEYLKNNQVRMVKSKKLLARIQDFWGVE